MNTQQTLNALAVAAGAWASAVHAQSPITANVGGTPNDGMVCRSGYASAFDGRSLKCSKTSRIVVQLVCANPAFPTLVARTSGNGTPQGEDVCRKSGNSVVFDSDDRIGPNTDFREGVDWVLATANATAISQKTTERDAEEAAAIGGSASDVETVAASAVLNRNAEGILDRASVLLTHFTFATPTAGLINTGSLPTTTSATFVPRALPR